MSFKSKVSGLFSAIGRGVRRVFRLASSSITGENVEAARGYFEALIKIGDEMIGIGEDGLNLTEDGELDPIDAAALLKQLAELSLKVKKLI